MDENENKTKQVTKALTEESICEVISKSITEIVNMSKDEDFKAKCCALMKTNTDAVNLEANLKKYFLEFMVKRPPKKRSSFDAFFNTAISKRKYVSLESLIKDMFHENIDEDVNTIEELYGFDSWTKLIPENTE